MDGDSGSPRGTWWPGGGGRGFCWASRHSAKMQTQRDVTLCHRLRPRSPGEMACPREAGGEHSPGARGGIQPQARPCPTREAQTRPQVGSYIGTWGAGGGPGPHTSASPPAGPGRAPVGEPGRGSTARRPRDRGGNRLSDLGCFTGTGSNLATDLPNKYYASTTCQAPSCVRVTIVANVGCTTRPHPRRTCSPSCRGLSAGALRVPHGGRHPRGPALPRPVSPTDPHGPAKARPPPDSGQLGAIPAPGP